MARGSDGSNEPDALSTGYGPDVSKGSPVYGPTSSYTVEGCSARAADERVLGQVC